MAGGSSSQPRAEGDERRDELIRFGRELFSRHAYDALSIDDIAAAAGVSKGLLYHYFESKRDYYLAVVRAVTEEMRAVLPDPALPPDEQLRQGIEGYLDFAENHAQAFRGVLEGGVGSDAEVRQIVEEIRTLYIERILAALSIQSPSPILRLALRGWVGFGEAATVQWLGRRDFARADLSRMLIGTLNAAFECARRIDPAIDAP
jgi:AcrR family transcriptional regulator